MASFAHLAPEEKTGLLVAGVAHVALVAALMVQVGYERDYTPPQRINVSLATDVSLRSTAPDPSEEPASSQAPTLSELPVPEASPPVETVVPEPVERPAAPVQRPQTQQRTERVARPTPTPTPTSRIEELRPEPPRQQTQQASGSRLNETFLEGVSDSTGSQGQVAEAITPQVSASLSSAVNRQLKPHWNPPSGVEVERLVTVVRFRLNRDGSLRGNPEIVRQTGITESNRSQAGRHSEQAIRAVRLASPFRLPEAYYSGWRTIEFDFDNRLTR